MGEGIVKRPRKWTFLMSCLEAIPSSHLMSSLYAVTTCGTYPASGTAWRGLSRCQYELLFSLLWWEKRKRKKNNFPGFRDFCPRPLATWLHLLLCQWPTGSREKGVWHVFLLSTPPAWRWCCLYQGRVFSPQLILSGNALTHKPRVCLTNLCMILSSVKLRVKIKEHTS